MAKEANSISYGLLILPTITDTHTMEPKFSGGINIAIKIPKSKYEQTVHFYRDILKLDVTEKQIDHPTISRTHRASG